MVSGGFGEKKNDCVREMFASSARATGVYTCLTAHTFAVVSSVPVTVPSLVRNPCSLIDDGVSFIRGGGDNRRRLPLTTRR